MADEPQDAQGQVDQSASPRSNDDRGDDLKSNAPDASSLQMTKDSRDEQPGANSAAPPILRLLMAKERKTKIETIHYDSGAVYEGEVEDGERNGRGIFRHISGNVYDGEWKGGIKQGKGTETFASGDVYEGDFGSGKRNGRGVYNFASGLIYEGEWEDDLRNGSGTLKEANGCVYEGEWKGGNLNGHGRVKFPSGDIYEGVWRDGLKEEKGKMKWANGDTQSGRFEWIGAPKLPNLRMLRSQRSQQQRTEKNVATKTCEHCGADDGHYKLRICSGCNLALYCSLSCQRRARGSHRRICNIVSGLPSRDAERLALEYDKETKNDFDAGLRYATKYMNNLKHLAIDFTKSSPGDGNAILSSVTLRSLFKSKEGALDSFIWDSTCRISSGDGGDEASDAWKELRNLKQLRLSLMQFKSTQLLYDIITQQKNTLVVLCLPELNILWDSEGNRKTLALAISFCKHLVKLDLEKCVLLNDDLEIMLYDLPNLRCLNLERHQNDGDVFSGFTDEACETLATKCPVLQHLDLKGHRNLPVAGIRKIFEGCIHLRSFCTSTLNLSEEDIRALLDIAPQLLCLAFDKCLTQLLSIDGVVISRVLHDLIEATAGKTLFLPGYIGEILDPRGLESLSAEARDQYDRQMKVFDEVTRRKADPEIANEWETMLEE